MRPFHTLTLHTDRLLLRPLAEHDAPALFAIHADPDVMRYWSTAPWTDIQQAHDLIARDKQWLPAGDSLRLGMVRKVDQALLGTVSLFNFMAQCRRAEIGYCLASHAWGQGLMHEALTAMVRFAFDDLELNRLEADIDPLNLGSARSLERLGFSREGYLRERWIVGGVKSDSALYGLLRTDWQATQPVDIRHGEAASAPVK